jgi:DNA polymerase-3 subunit delta'
MLSEEHERLWPRVIGQDRVKRILLAALRAGRLPHAYLFYGADGVGKDAMALELARVLHCERNGTAACGVCPSCERAANGTHPDIRIVVPLPVGKNESSDDDPLAKLNETDLRAVQDELREKASNPYHRVSVPRATIIKINSIRDVRRESTMSTFDGRRRVYIISPADAMGEEAANTLLKTLEEPSGDCMLILATSRRDALLPTILSRCQNVRFDPLTEADLMEALIERNSLDRETAGFVARLANGSYTAALGLLAEETLQERAFVPSFVRHVLGGSVLPLIEDVERFAAARDRVAVERFLALLLMWFRDAMVMTRGGRIINVDQEEDLRRFTARFPQADLLRAMADIERALSLVGRNVYIKLILLQLSVQLRRTIATTA